MTSQNIQKLKNIGPTSASWLEAVEIRTLNDLASVGAVEAYCRIRLAGYSTTLNLLYALQGAITNTKWNQLTAETKQTLKAALAERDLALSTHLANVSVKRDSQEQDAD